ncbi:unnamed protein product [Microthlaspi erraticum]|uniref:Uncharacterized protein n=1 Tax=Microthlaspi erraticum TaxID=1685480 RepID=A0A6D2JSF3_9BRAS|nr:unnamed protein product [Microthlaspi erraticum]
MNRNRLFNKWLHIVEGGLYEEEKAFLGAVESDVALDCFQIGSSPPYSAKTIYCPCHSMLAGEATRKLIRSDFLHPLILEELVLKSEFVKELWRGIRAVKGKKVKKRKKRETSLPALEPPEFSLCWGWSFEVVIDQVNSTDEDKLVSFIGSGGCQTHFKKKLVARELALFNPEKFNEPKTTS